MSKRNEFKMQFGVMSAGKWTGEWHQPCGEIIGATLQQLRQPTKYWVVSDTQLKRDLAGRTLADVYRDNKNGRIDGVTQYSPPFGKYVPRTLDGPSVAHGPRQTNQTLLQEYLADCYARGHEPHPASIDRDHPLNCHRLKAPRKDIDFVQSVPLAMAA